MLCLFFGLQTFDILRLPYKIGFVKTCVILQLPLLTRNCDTVISYHKNYTLSFSWNILLIFKV
jgi:hypothetical protein